MENFHDLEQRVARLEAAIFGLSDEQSEAYGALEASASKEFKNPRAYLRKHVNKSTSGAKKFTLVVACLTGGIVGDTVHSDAVVELWSGLRCILGSYNGAHATRATEKGWVDSPPRKKEYTLGANWKEVLED